MKRPNRMKESLKLPGLTYRVWSVWRRNFDVFMKTWKVDFFPPLLEPLFYLVALGYGLGTFVQKIEGLSYIQFIAPALVAISVMNSSLLHFDYSHSIFRWLNVFINGYVFYRCRA